MLDKITSKIVFANKLAKFKSDKCFGKIIVQYNICKTGNKKLIKKTIEQKTMANKDLAPVKFTNVLDLKPPLDSEWYWAFFLEKFSNKNKPNMKINK